MELLRLCIAESLRMYPEPPLLIRRALEEDTLPAGATGEETKVLRGMDFFVSIYNLHRDEKCHLRLRPLILPEVQYKLDINKIYA